jgi:hypothetical protein
LIPIMLWLNSGFGRIVRPIKSTSTTVQWPTYGMAAFKERIHQSEKSPVFLDVRWDALKGLVNSQMSCNVLVLRTVGFYIMSEQRMS